MTALRQVCQGQHYVSTALVGHLMHEIAETDNPLYPALSRREEQVLQLLATGYSLKEIAHELGVNVKTVSTYRLRLLKKLHLRTTAELIRYALQHKFVE